MTYVHYIHNILNISVNLVQNAGHSTDYVGTGHRETKSKTYMRETNKKRVINSVVKGGFTEATTLSPRRTYKLCWLYNCQFNVVGKKDY